MFLAASADRIARLRTSSATTAKPLPASPARAASTAALRASRLVWKAISSMTLIILAVSSELLRISLMALAIRFIESVPLLAALRASAARVLACVALAAFCLVIDDISSRLEEVSSRPAACSVAPCASDWDAEEICSEALASWSEPSASCPTMEFNFPVSLPATISQQTSVTAHDTSIRIPSWILAECPAFCISIWPSWNSSM